MDIAGTIKRLEKIDRKLSKGKVLSFDDHSFLDEVRNANNQTLEGLRKAINDGNWTFVK